MSGLVSGAVKQRGPAKLRLCAALDAIADTSDDFGFSVTSMPTIAMKCRCSERHAMRLVQQLEDEGWMRVERDVVNGKANVYFIDIERLEVKNNPKSKRGPMWDEVTRLLRRRDEIRNRPEALPFAPEEKAAKVSSMGLFGDLSGDRMSRVNPENEQNSHDISPPTQVTLNAESHDISGLPIRKNVVNVLNVTPIPPSPRSGGDYDAAVAKVRRECSLSNPRLEKVVRDALTLEASRSDAVPDWNEIAERMIEAHKAYAELGREGLLKATFGVAKFFGNGVWRDHGLWMIDHETRRLRSESRVGRQV